jgi:hypothetical protein
MKIRALGAEQLARAIKMPTHANARSQQTISGREAAGPHSEKHRAHVNGGGVRSLEQEWLREHGAEYAFEWVALDGAKLVAHGKSARQVLETAKTMGYDRPLIVQVPEEPELPFGGW